MNMTPSGINGLPTKMSNRHYRHYYVGSTEYDKNHYYVGGAEYDKNLIELIEKVTVDVFGRLHSHDGKPALILKNGEELYYYHGIHVPKYVLMGTFTSSDIDGEFNAEVRGVMLKIYGLERYINESRFRVTSEDSYGRLLVKTYEVGEPLKVVEVKNKTVEPDGSRKVYFLRVPPTVRSALEGIAWTFGMEYWEYKPDKET